MALINCPECDKQVSDKAKACPNCGFPIDELSKVEDQLKFPKLPIDLSVGEQIPANFRGKYNNEENVITKINPGIVHVIMHQNGISISGPFFSNPYSIHNAQIIDLKQTSRKELGTLSKDLIGRAVVGAIIYGPVGAAIGALTAKNQHDEHFLIINYWDIDTKSAQSLLISSDKFLITTFIKKYKEVVANSARHQENSKSIVSKLQEITAEKKEKTLPIQGDEINTWKSGFKQIGWLENIGLNTQKILSNSLVEDEISSDSLLCVSYADVKGSRITSLYFGEIDMYSQYTVFIATTNKFIIVRPDKKLLKSVGYSEIDSIATNVAGASGIYNIRTKSNITIFLNIKFSIFEDQKILDLFFERILFKS